MQRFTEGLIIALAIPALTVLAITSVTDESASDFIQQADKNHDGYITPDELKAAMASWLGGREGATQEQLSSALETAFPNEGLRSGEALSTSRARQPGQPSTARPFG